MDSIRACDYPSGRDLGLALVHLLERQACVQAKKYAITLCCAVLGVPPDLAPKMFLNLTALFPALSPLSPFSFPCPLAFSWILSAFATQQQQRSRESGGGADEAARAGARAPQRPPCYGRNGVSLRTEHPVRGRQSLAAPGTLLKSFTLSLLV